MRVTIDTAIQLGLLIVAIISVILQNIKKK